MQKHYAKTIELADRYIDSLLSTNHICKNSSSPSYNGIVTYEKGFAEPAHSVGAIHVMVCCYYNSMSKHYNDKAMLENANDLMDFTYGKLHDDGTIDLMETNFHDATACSFMIQNLGHTYKVLERFCKNSALEIYLKDKLYALFEKSVKGYENGGFHTPNHRWVVSSALSFLYNILHDESLKTEAFKYLDEGIDCDSEGEYTERSAGVYNVINNRSMIIIANEFNMPELYSHVERNLDMVIKYFEPDNSICTMNSTRQDFGSKIFPVVYYENLILMAYITKNPVYNYLADQVFNMIYYKSMNSFSPNDVYNNTIVPTAISEYMLNDDFAQYQPTEFTVPCYDFVKYFENSGIVRGRHDNISWTLVKDITGFFKFVCGNNSVYLKIAGSFFGPKGRFMPETIVKTQTGYHVEYSRKWGYKKPLGKMAGSCNWHKIDHCKRADTMLCDFKVCLDFAEVDGGVEIHMETEGVSDVPIKLEFIFQPNGFFQSESVNFDTIANQTIFAKDKFSYEYNNDTITIDGGFFKHKYGKNLRGSDAPSENMFTVYMTDFTNTKHDILIKGE